MKRRSQNTARLQEHELASTWNSFVDQLKQTGYMCEDSEPSTTASGNDNRLQTSRRHKRTIGATLLKQLGVVKDSSNV